MRKFVQDPKNRRRGLWLVVIIIIAFVLYHFFGHKAPPAVPQNQAVPGNC